MTCRVDDLDFGVRLTWNIGFLVFFLVFFLRFFFPVCYFFGLPELSQININEFRIWANLCTVTKV